MTVHEGEPFKIKEVTFVPANHAAIPFPEKKLHGLLRLKEDKRYREEDLVADYNKITEFFSNGGYPYIWARVKPHLDHQQHTVVLEWLLDPGPLCKVGKITITGNQSVSEKAIRRGLGFKEGDLFVQKKLYEAQRQIYRLELFQFVSLKATKLEEKPLAIPIEVRVRETKLRTLKLGLGYGSEEAFRTTLNWRHRNFLGGARILRAQAKHSTKLLPISLELELSQPYFLDNKNDLTLKPFFIWQDEKSFEARRIGAETSINRQLSRNMNLFINYRFERDSVRIKGEVPEAILSNLFNKSVGQIGWRRNTTNDIFAPSKGSMNSVIFEMAGLAFRSKFKYLKFIIENRFYQKLDSGYIFAFRLLLGSMKPIRGSNITPVEERFFSGGSYSVRGWRRQLLGPRDEFGVPVGGNTLLEGNLELRNPIYKKLSGAVFLDYGNVWGDWLGFDLLNLHYAVGFGLRYNTFIGPIRLDFAWKINKQPFDDRRFQLHVSIGQAF